MKRSPLKRKAKMRRGAPLRSGGPFRVASIDRRTGTITLDGIPPKGTTVGLVWPCEVGDVVKTWWSKPRKPLRKVGARSKREAGALAKFRKAIRARAKQGAPTAWGPVTRCERCCRIEMPEIFGQFDPHHIVPRSRAAGWPSLHEPDLNGLLLCRYPCHDELTRYPKGTEHEPRAIRRRIARAFAAFEKWRAGAR